MSRGARRRLVAAAGLAILAATKGIAFSLLVPPFHGPDEPLHFDYVQALAENQTLPPPEVACRGPMFSPEVRAAVVQIVNGVAFHPDVPVPLPATLDLPTGPGSRATAGCGPASIYPPLWYATGALAYGAAGDRPLLQRLLVVRWVSVAWGVAVVLAALALGLLTF